METESGVEHRTGVATYVVEVVVALLIVVLGLVVLQGSWKLGSGWTSDGPGAGYFPFYIGIILCISGAGVAFQALKNKNMEVFVDNEQLKRVLSVLLPALVYVLFIQLIGIYVASVVYIALFMVILGKYSPIKSVITAIAVNALFFMMFEVWFKVPLFKGMWDPISFLGY
ncbi:tripartite tricarboxylate transporter TctB family protein [uncultured Ramlibacter sp.]|uniref:tripartite tricarboxylate transporter TctB family protein n=1 Tax=uncultured Ramlibacter sp. TaxID=260755 RepID=UPI002634FB9A|nr:tripartite tricarboxylate transporter TctB family protein [uncultured Ramlibacter sp.]